MIILKLRGGLGNQMFQYAFGKSLARKNNEFLVLNLDYYRSKARTFNLDDLNVSYDFKIKNKLVLKLLEILPQMEGFWESYKYFQEQEAFIKKEFTLKKISPFFSNVANSIEKEKSISIHVRRGDYLNPNDQHFLLQKQFYELALRYIVSKKNLLDPQITIFSDDKEWCQKELPQIAGFKTKISNENSITDVEELFLMSTHANNIISNSTFSWWAAYLNKNNDKIIVAPKNWFKDREKNEKAMEDLILPRWKLF